MLQCMNAGRLAVLSLRSMFIAQSKPEPIEALIRCPVKHTPHKPIWGKWLLQRNF